MLNKYFEIPIEYKENYLSITSPRTKTKVCLSGKKLHKAIKIVIFTFFLILLDNKNSIILTTTTKKNQRRKKKLHKNMIAITYFQ